MLVADKNKVLDDKLAIKFDDIRIPFPINKHPMIEENKDFKLKYVNIIDYFSRKYQNDDFLRAVIDLYIELFDLRDSYNYNEYSIKEYFKIATAVRVKKFKFFSYRYILAADCLFVSSLNNSNNIHLIVNELKTLFKKRYHKKLDDLTVAFTENYETTNDKIKKYIAYLKAYKEFMSREEIRVLVTANMSAGKSTLLNALVGKRVSRTSNEACTAKIHYILNKPVEDGFVYEWDGRYNLNANNNDLMDDAPENTSRYIGVGTYFNSDILSQKRFVFIDTPGVDYSGNPEHADITKSFINSGNYDCIIYVIAPPIEADADERHLKYICENCKGKKIIFVINKLDNYRTDEDSIDSTVIHFSEHLKKIGFDNPIVCPVSAYAAVLAKKKMSGIEFNRSEDNWHNMFLDLFKEKEFNMKKYYDYEYGEGCNKEDKEKALLNECGLVGLEKILINI